MRRCLVAVLVTTVACAAEEEAPTYGDQFGTPDNPVPKAGAYEVISRFNISVEMPHIEPAIADLRAFSQNPGRSLLAKAKGASDLLASLPVSLRDRLEGWINVELDKIRISGKTLKQYAAEATGIAETTLTRFTIESSLAISPPDQVKHSFTALNFTPVALDIVVPIGVLAADTLTQQTTAVVAEGGALSLGDQRFRLAFGDHAWHGINLANTTLYGTNMQATLSTALACPTLAQVVSTKCYNGSCVGNTTQLRAVCESGVETLVDELVERIGVLDLDVFRFMRGGARLVDENLDGVAEKLADGTWEIQLDLGLGLNTAPATFTAIR
jgi:hypothetical protein